MLTRLHPRSLFSITIIILFQFCSFCFFLRFFYANCCGKKSNQIFGQEERFGRQFGERDACYIDQVLSAMDMRKIVTSLFNAIFDDDRLDKFLTNFRTQTTKAIVNVP